MTGFRFWYFAELFMLLHWGGAIHCSWWWIVYLFIVDASEYLAFRRDTGMPPLLESLKAQGAK